MRKLILLVSSGLAVVALALAPAAPGGNDREREVMRTGSCSGASTWKLKAKLDNGRLETEFEVDQNRVGRRWSVTLRRNGAVSFRGTRRTVAPSGSFELRRLLDNGAGVDRIAASARALTGGEVCRGSLSY